MNVFEVNDYKKALRERTREIRKRRPKMTMRYLASKIPIQYTYLSKALSQPAVHLNEDDLFSLCRMLEFLSEETEYLCLLRAVETSHEPIRRSHLKNKAERIRRSQELAASMQQFQSSQLNQDMSYLFDPMAIVVHVSLFNKDYAAHPKRLCSLLGISASRLQRILKNLSQAQFIELSETGEIVSVLKGQIHYGTDHPLMRAHQGLLKSQSAARVQQAEESDKYSIISTFVTDEPTFKKLQDRLKAFLKEAETLVRESRPEGTFQLNLDLFRWL